MRLARTDLLPLLVVIAGAGVGAVTSAAFLLSPSSGHEADLLQFEAALVQPPPTPVQAAPDPVPPESGLFAIRWSPDGKTFVFKCRDEHGAPACMAESRGERPMTALLADGRWSAFKTGTASGVGFHAAREVPARAGTAPIVYSRLGEFGVWLEESRQRR